MKVFTQLTKKSAKGTVGVLIFLAILAVFGNFIAAERGQYWVPPLIPYAYYTQDAENNDFISPFNAQQVASIYYWHWLGTDQVGRDVLAGLIAGTRTALLIGLGGMGIALIIGLFFGMAAGYFGNKHFRLTRIGLILRGVFLALLIFYFTVFFQQELPFYYFFLLTFVFVIVVKLLESLIKRIPFFNKTIAFPLDALVMRVVEVIQSVPTILWLLGLIGATGRLSLQGLVLFIGFTGWTTTARMVRGEILRIRQLEFIENAQALGFSNARIILRHALPNVLTPVLIAAAFGIANCILLEAFLTFSGLGLPIEQVTWGNMLNNARNNPQAWWLVVFPGLMIFLTVYSLNRLGEALNER